MKKLVIIGANNFQLPLIKKARQLGFETHVFAWEKGAVGKKFADYFYPISIIEKELILKEAEKIKPDGIISIGSDLATATVNYIADKLGLIGNSLECTRVTTNKFAMRNCLSQSGLPCPKFTKSADIQEILSICGDYPLIVKPIDRSGSRGVTKVSNQKDLEQAIARAKSESFTSGHIVEQFIEGQEYSVEMISWQGEHHFLQVTEKETSGEPFYVEKAHHQPAAFSASMRDKIIAIIKKSLTCLGIEFGASHSEILVKGDGNIYIVEIGARMGGDYIGSHLVELSTGYDFMKGVIDIACGNFNGIVKSQNMYSGIYYVFAKPGMLHKITNKTKKYPEILFSEMYFRIGGITREVKESNDRAASYIYQSASGKFICNDEIIILESTTKQNPFKKDKMKNIKTPLISIVSPVFGCRAFLSELYSRLKETLEKITPEFEIILINDASPDNAWETIIELAKMDSRVKGINLSRNFGQHYAITAGLDHCKGEWVVVMDCDLQDQPEEIVKLYGKAMEGFQIVYAQRIKRKDKWLKRTYSKLFYMILGYFTNTKQDPSIGNFGIYHKNVIDSILAMNDYHRYFPTMVRWVGFKHTKINVSHAERTEGRSAYSLKKLINMGMDIIVSFSDKPLKLMVKFGFLIASISFSFAIHNLILFLNHKIKVLGYASLIISIWLFSGIIIMVLGIVGLYIGKTFDRVKGRPTYLIMEKTFSDGKKHD